MTWNSYYQVFPKDLEARIEAARTAAERAFNQAKSGRSRADIRQLLINRIKAEVIEWALCACEAAWRGGPDAPDISQVKPFVDLHLRRVVLDRFSEIDPHPNSASSESFVREAVEQVTKSLEWDAYLEKLKSVAKRLAASGPATNSPNTGDAPTVPAAGDRLPPLETEEQTRAAVTALLKGINRETEEIYRPTDFWKAAKEYQDRKTFTNWLKGGPESPSSQSPHQAFCRVLLLSRTEFVAARRLWRKKPKRKSPKKIAAD
jgi:hypothetical protein